MAGRKAGKNGGAPVNLREQVFTVSPRATPSARDWKDTPGMAQEAFDTSGKFRNRIDQLARQAYQVSAWPTPTRADAANAANDTAGRSNSESQHHSGTTLVDAARGLLSSGCHASAGSGGPFLLNPRFSLWLMGYPTEWARCAERVTRSARKSPRSSSSRRKRQ
jgi:hypothetical protein